MSFYSFTVGATSASLKAVPLVYLLLVPAEGEGEGLKSGLHVQTALRCRQGFQCQHVGHPAVPGNGLGIQIHTLHCYTPYGSILWFLNYSPLTHN